MTNYVKAVDFAAKDTLVSGDPNKIIKGTEINTELVNIQTAINTKANINSPEFTGTPLTTTAAAGTNTTQIASTAYVMAERSNTATLTNKTLTSPTISGGTVTGITDLAVADGGTGASTASGARTNLGLVIGTDVAPVASPAFTGTPTAPTASTGTNTTQLATTAHVYATGALKADKATTVSAGTGLSGGGDLSANRTLAIANTGVTANTYGSVSAIPVLAINAQGQVTSASTVSIGITTGAGSVASGASFTVTTGANGKCLIQLHPHVVASFANFGTRTVGISIGGTVVASGTLSAIEFDSRISGDGRTITYLYTGSANDNITVTFSVTGSGGTVHDAFYSYIGT